MEYVRLYVNAPNHPKVLGISDAAFRAWAELLCYAGQYETDGLIPAPILSRYPAAALQELAAVHLLDDCASGGCRIHNFEHRQKTASQMEQARSKARERKERWAKRSSEGVGTASGTALLTAFPKEEEEEEEEREKEVRISGPNGPSSASLTDVVERATEADVLEVFATWIRASGKTAATRLDEKRRRRIRWALARFSKADVLAAVQGWKNSPHHSGQNETGMVYNELTLLLRDVEHVEKFRELHHNGAAPRLVPGRKEHPLEVADRELAERAAQLRAAGR